ncbi:unnamed protein product [Ectocarpus sp. CCAP 1310/34]|nr:unnamed protein product [Ectocarpus sp. CCAP 1310/34]
MLPTPFSRSGPPRGAGLVASLVGRVSVKAAGV